jgi:hypothetical protein
MPRSDKRRASSGVSIGVTSALLKQAGIKEKK